MTPHRGHMLGAEEAARIIYATGEPTALQVYRVKKRLKSGVLKGRCDSEGQWTTTPAWVAEYMAAQACRSQRSDERSGESPAGSPASRSGDAQLRPIYVEALQQYFLAVIFRRRLRSTSRHFRQLVLVGQAAILCLLLGAAVTAFRSLGAGHPERAAVQRWLEANVDRCIIEEWLPTVAHADGEGVLVRVRYRYSAGRERMVHTEQTFLVGADQVRRVVLDDEDDP